MQVKGLRTLGRRDRLIDAGRKFRAQAGPWIRLVEVKWEDRLQDISWFEHTKLYV
jgi:hypothetical protein